MKAAIKAEEVQEAGRTQEGYGALKTKQSKYFRRKRMIPLSYPPERLSTMTLWP